MTSRNTILYIKPSEERYGTEPKCVTGGSGKTLGSIHAIEWTTGHDWREWGGTHKIAICMRCHVIRYDASAPNGPDDPVEPEPLVGALASAEIDRCDGCGHEKGPWINDQDDGETGARLGIVCRCRCHDPLPTAQEV